MIGAVSAETLGNSRTFIDVLYIDVEGSLSDTCTLDCYLLVLFSDGLRMMGVHSHLHHKIPDSLLSYRGEMRMEGTVCVTSSFLLSQRMIVNLLFRMLVWRL